MVAGVAARHEHAVDPLRSERVGGDGGGQRRVDTAGQPQDHRGEPVLADVVAGGQHQGRVDLAEVVRARGHGVGQRPVGRQRGVGDQVAFDGDAVGLRRRAPHARSLRPRQFQVRHQKRLLEPRGARDQVPGGVHDQGVAVEDQFVLAADHVDVGQCHVGLAGAAGAQLQPRVPLVALVRRPVQHHQQGGPGLAHGGDRAAVLPQVLADHEGRVDAVQPHHREDVSGDEVAELVEHPVVGQVVLGGGEDRPPPVQQGHRVLRGPDRLAQRGGRGSPAAAQVADGDGKLAQSLGGEPPGQGVHGLDGGVDEGPAQREVLHRVSGDHHLGKHHQVSPCLGRPARVLDDDPAVSFQVSHSRVDLGHSQSQLCHDNEPNARLLPAFPWPRPRVLRSAHSG